MPDDPQRKRFNPFVNEGDMFKVVLWVAAAMAVLIALVVLGRAVF